MTKKYEHIVVFGAGGRTGRLLVMKLHEKGYKVRAFMHRKHLAQEGVEVMVGDITDLDAVKKALKDQKAVISVVSHGRRSPANMQAMGMRLISDEMVKIGAKRIISLTGSGVRQPGDNITFFERFLTFGILITHRSRVTDGQHHAELLSETPLDWTVLRVAKLTNGEETKKWKLKKHGPAKNFVSRADVADAIIEILEKDKFIESMPLISNP